MTTLSMKYLFKLNLSVKVNSILFDLSLSHQQLRESTHLTLPPKPATGSCHYLRYLNSFFFSFALQIPSFLLVQVTASARHLRQSGEGCQTTSLSKIWYLALFAIFFFLLQDVADFTSTNQQGFAAIHLASIGSHFHFLPAFSH